MKQRHPVLKPDAIRQVFMAATSYGIFNVLVNYNSELKIICEFVFAGIKTGYVSLTLASLRITTLPKSANVFLNFSTLLPT